MYKKCSISNRLKIMKTRNNLGEDTKNMHEMEEEEDNNRTAAKTSQGPTVCGLLWNPAHISLSYALPTPTRAPTATACSQRRKRRRGVGAVDPTPQRLQSPLARAPAPSPILGTSEAAPEGRTVCCPHPPQGTSAWGHCAVSENTVFPQEPSKIAGKSLSSFKRPRF